MSLREICISAYPEGYDGTPEHIAPLLNRFVDSFSAIERYVYDQEAGGGELWFAHWDAEKGELSTESGPGSVVAITGLKGYPDTAVLRFLPALCAALDIAVNG